jgi:hypothetical protein
MKPRSGTSTANLYSTIGTFAHCRRFCFVQDYLVTYEARGPAGGRSFKMNRGQRNIDLRTAEAAASDFLRLIT